MPDTVKSNEGDGRSSYTLQWLNAHASEPLANDDPPAGDEDEQEFAVRLYQLCLRALHDLYRWERDQSSSSSRSNVLRECLGRLYLWGEPFAVGELDKALRQSDELSDNVLERLGHIGKLLLRKSAPSVPPSKVLQQLSKQVEGLESIIKQTKLIVSQDQGDIPQNDYEKGEEYDSGSEDLSDSASYDTIEDIGFASTCLVELGPSLKQNLEHARIVRNQHTHLTGAAFSVSGPAMIYVSLVREKFKQAHYKLIERLGEANWQRHKSIREKMDNTELFPEERAKPAGSLFHPYSDFHDSGIGTSVPPQSEYAPSHTSFQSSNIEGEHVSLRVPREPSEVGAGKPFQCFLCTCVISNVRNRVDWKMHVFADLRPYICTFSDCKDELAQFTTRAAWADHEFTKHRYDQIWKCPECSKELAGASDWEQHLQEMHELVFTGPQLRVARNTAYQMQPRPAETEECPLCRIVLGKPRRAFVTHIARHMEEIALMALPRSTEDDSDKSSISTDQVSRRSEKVGMLAAELQFEARKGKIVQTTTASVPSISTHPQDSIYANDEVKDYIIKCICGYLEDDGNTVYCDLCHTWQHTDCYYIDKNGNVPTTEELEVIDHFCADCQPRSLNAQGAVERQRIRRNVTQAIGKNKQMGKRATSGTTNEQASFEGARVIADRKTMSIHQ